MEKERKFVITLSNDNFQVLRDALEEAESRDLKSEADTTIIRQLFQVGDADIRVFVTIKEVSYNAEKNLLCDRGKSKER